MTHEDLAIWDVAERLGMEDLFVYRLIERGDLPYHKSPHWPFLRIPAAGVNEFEMKFRAS